MSVKARHNVLVAAAYITLLLVLGAVAHRLLFPPASKVGRADAMLFQANENLLDIADTNMPVSEARSNVPADRPWVPPATLPRERPAATPRSTPPLRVALPPTDAPPPGAAPFNGERRSGSRCRPCVRPGSPTPSQALPVVDPIPESVGLHRTTLPITSQP